MENIISVRTNHQPERLNRILFTSARGIIFKKRWVMLDIDETGMTYRGRKIDEYFSSMYDSIEEIIIHERSFILEVKNKHYERKYKIDLLKLEGNLWENYRFIKDILLRFAGKNTNAKLVIIQD